MTLQAIITPEKHMSNTLCPLHTNAQHADFFFWLITDTGCPGSNATLYNVQKRLGQRTQGKETGKKTIKTQYRQQEKFQILSFTSIDSLDGDLYKFLNF